MAGPTTPVDATFPLPPPVGKLPFVDQTGYLTPSSWTFLQILWASIQGGGGLIDQILANTPSFGSISALVEGLLANDARAETEFMAVLGQLQGLRQQIDDLTVMASAPPMLLQPASGAGVPTSEVLLASESIAAGAIISVWNNSGVANWRNADVVDDTKTADGFTLTAGTAGNVLTGQLIGQVNTQVAGLTPGGVVFLAASGALTQTVPSTGWLQIVGKASAANRLIFQPQTGTLLP